MLMTGMPAANNPTSSMMTCAERRRGDRPCEVWNDSDGRGFAQRHHLDHLGDAADVRKRGPNVVDILVVEEPVEIPSLPPFFAVGQRARRHLAQLRDLFERLFVPDRIFDEIWL